LIEKEKVYIDDILYLFMKHWA